MYDIAICDDSIVDCTHLKEYINTITGDEGQIRVHEYHSGEELLRAAETVRFALIFLDIQMEGMDGEEAARRLRRQDDSVILVFITGAAEPSPQSFEVQAYRYIKKNMAGPQKEQYIRDSLNRMREVGRMPVLPAKCDGVMVCFKPDDIVYMEKYKKNTRVYLTKAAQSRYEIDCVEREVRIGEKLEHLYELLKPWGFGYPHNSYVINFKHLMMCVGTEFRLEGYEKIKFGISRNKAQEFRQQKNLFMTEKYQRREEG